MKLTRTRLRRLILETMMTPSRLIQDVMNDQSINPKIKELIQSGLDNNDLMTVQSALSMVAGLYPQYAPEFDATDPQLLMPDYHDKFEQATDLGHSARNIAEAERLVDEVLEPYRHLADFEVGGSYHDRGYGIEITAANDKVPILKQIQADFKARGLDSEIYDWYADYYGEHTLEVFFGDGSPKSQRRYGHGVRTGNV